MSAAQDDPIPQVDLAPITAEGPGAASAQPVLDALRTACSEVGFVTITGHGVPLERVAEIVGAAQQFFALPDADKLGVAPRQWNPGSPNVYRGYFPSSANGKEGLDIGDPTLGAEHSALLGEPYYERNRFPPTLGEDWQDTIERYFAALSALGRILMEAMVTALAGDPSRIAPAFARPRGASTLRFNYYPGLEVPASISAEDGTPLACETHVDSGVLTILYQDRMGGLQVRDRERRWHDVPFDASAFVVNTGLAFQLLSGRAFAATPHRVRFTAGRRLSIPFFYEPAHDFPIEPRSLGLPGKAPSPVLNYGAFLKDSLAKFPEYQRDA